MKRQFKTTAYTDLSDFIFGKAKHPITLKNGMIIGGGTVYPEINFTLPTMSINSVNIPEIIESYKNIVTRLPPRPYRCDRRLVGSVEDAVEFVHAARQKQDREEQDTQQRKFFHVQIV